ncbi:NTE family protein [Roseiarcus fermentans]|uniref:NTE family protein n=1 Tax=Roseiarcus fermentans TaxID=1473586 RepID=A0A366EY97_9HYPH|nr:patatin-like phospholipase family protein [Roseiarcus fermentans]RBP07357.1 NTE family protein [Roseiarcus fermentans]
MSLLNNARALLRRFGLRGADESAADAAGAETAVAAPISPAPIGAASAATEGGPSLSGRPAADGPAVKATQTRVAKAAPQAIPPDGLPGAAQAPAPARLAASVSRALSARRPAPWPPEQLSLALQGGGSFGAFAWGVLDRLLEEPGIAFDSVSGSSAGAVNAVLLASGMIEGGRAGARARLSRFWRRASQAAALAPAASSPLTAGLELITRLMSPYQFNPFNVNPLREALEAEVDFERLRERSRIKLLLGATRVRDGSLRILTNEDLTVDAVLASACLPLLHHAIELDGEAYWDGGYAANPPLIPLVRASEAEHVLIVQVTPNLTDRLPRTTSEIAARIEQIQFNATLNSELEALEYGKIIGAADKLRKLRIGRISADDHFVRFGAESAANLRWEFLARLFLGGRAAAGLWLNQGLPALRRRA